MLSWGSVPNPPICHMPVREMRRSDTLPLYTMPSAFDFPALPFPVSLASAPASAGFAASRQTPDPGGPPHARRQGEEPHQDDQEPVEGIPANVDSALRHPDGELRGLLSQGAVDCQRHPPFPGPVNLCVDVPALRGKGAWDAFEGQRGLGVIAGFRWRGGGQLDMVAGYRLTLFPVQREDRKMPDADRGLFGRSADFHEVLFEASPPARRHRRHWPRRCRGMLRAASGPRPSPQARPAAAVESISRVARSDSKGHRGGARWVGGRRRPVLDGGRRIHARVSTGRGATAGKEALGAARSGCHRGPAVGGTRSPRTRRPPVPPLRLMCWPGQAGQRPPLRAGHRTGLGSSPLRRR